VGTAPKDTVAYCSPAGAPLQRLGEWISTHAYSSASDGCSGANYRMEINNNAVDSAQIVAAFLASYANGCGTQVIGGDTYNKVRGSVQVDFFVFDACDNETFAGGATFGAIDTLPPVISGTGTTESCGTNTQDNAALQAWINAHGNATFADECSAAVWTNFSYTTSNGQSGSGTFGAGPFPQVQAHNCTWFADVTFRATDECGNVGARTLRFQIQDTQAPVIAGFPNPVTLPCTAPTPSLSTTFVSDNCDTNMVITNSIVRSDSLCNGSYTMTVTWRATDDCGNTGSAVQTVFVRDTVGPTFTLVPAPKTFRCDTFVLPPAPMMGVGINATDNCSPVLSISTQTVSGQNPNPATCGHYSYLITRTFTATDQCGNTRSATQVLTVVDNLPPTFSGFTDTTGVCDVAPVLPPPVATDACSGAQVTLDTTAVTITPTCTDSYTITLNWIATDVCGNNSFFAQEILILDTVRPTLTNLPADITVECDAIPTAPATSTFSPGDNCDNDVAVALLQTELRDPSLASCDHWTNYIIRREWTATDNCGNTRRYTQNILVQDNTPPAIVPPVPIVRPNDPGDCGASVAIQPPISLYDKCTSLPVSVTLRDTALLVNTSGMPNNTTPVDIVVFEWTTPNTPPATPVVGPAALRIYLDNADSEQLSERFTILGENSTVLGTTNVVTPGQCGSGFTDVVIPETQLNSWLADGQLTLRLTPNGTGANAANAVCPGGRARAELSYQFVNQQVAIDLKFSLDAAPPVAFPPPAPYFLAPGLHTVVYTATDCAGNAASASSLITINDQELPIVTPPPTQVAYVFPGSCESVVTLPFPAISDNCGLSGDLTQASAILPLQFINDPNAGLIPGMLTLNLNGLIPNAVSGGILKVRHKGDNDEAGEFFTVFDENNANIGNTTLGSSLGQCVEFHESTLPVSAAQINIWAANGSASFKLVPNDEAGTFTEFIEPCAALLPDQTDGLSRVQVVLEYNFAVVTYEVRNSSGQLVQTGALNGDQTNLILERGNYTVKYLTTDVYGLEGSTTFQLQVLDTIAPTALCQSTTIFVNPSGAPGSNYVLQASEIDNGSADNCASTLAYGLSQSVFTCANAGNNFNVTLTVGDGAGNSAACTTIVRVEALTPMPSYTPVCEGGNLQLFTNPPTAPPNTFTYMWTGPGFASAQQNPVRSNAQISMEGPYTVKITGLTGCMATGVVTVDLANLPNQPVLNLVNANPCSGDNIMLSTPTYGGSNVQYTWFLGTPANPIQLAITGQPNFSLSEVEAGTYQFFVKVSADGCSSLNSEVITVVVTQRPVAVLDQDNISVCEGQPIVLGTSSQGAGMTYMWLGPGFSSNLQYPPAILSAAPFNAGTYSLVVKQNGCESKPAIALVTVRPKPPKPQIVGSNQVCEGATVTLVAANVPTAAQYLWQAPNTSIQTTLTNSLALPNVMVPDSGFWKVRVVQQGCISDWSDSVKVRVQAYPDVSAGSNSPICAGSNLLLTATGNQSGLSWVWTGPGVFLNFQQNPVVPPVAASGFYKVVGRTSFGCADSAFVEVLSVPSPVIDSVWNIAPICSDGTTDATLNAIVTTANGPVTYAWTGPNGLPFSVNPAPVIPNPTPTNNGPYTLIVRDIYNCPSAPKTTLLNVGPPLVIPLLTQPAAVCAGAPITLSVTNAGQYNPSATYTWVRPVGADTTTNQSFLNFPASVVGQSGNYAVIVRDGVCQSDTSAPASIVVSPIPPMPTVSSNSPVCEGDVLQLNASAVPGVSYAWTGPLGFTASIQNPVRQPVVSGFSGEYFVRVTANGCTSPVASTVVEVKPRPQKPVMITPFPAAICVDQPGATLTLTVSSGSATVGAQYVWLDAVGDTIAGPQGSVSALLGNLGSFPTGANSFRVVAWRNGCDSEVSNPVTVTFDTIPNNTAFAGVDGPVCTAQPITLAAAVPTLGSTGMWSQLGGLPVTIVSPGNPNSMVTGAQPNNGYQFVWSLSSGGCLNYSRDTVSLQAQAFEQAVAGADLFFCSVQNLALAATQGQLVSGLWSQPSSQANLGITINEPGNPQTPISGNALTPGNTYFFYWTLANPGCGAASDTVAVYIYSPKPNAGPDQFICNNNDCSLLDASNLQSFETGQWSALNAGASFTTPGNDQTTVCGLQPGANSFVWTINNGVCGGNSRDTVVVNFELFPTAEPDAVEVPFGTATTFDVLDNDVLPFQYSIRITVPPVQGRIVDTLDTGVYAYQPNSNFSGEDQMEYEICNLRCPDACSYATVTFQVAGPGECFLPNIITPNGDDLNDAFKIPETCLVGEGGVVVTVTIFNQWGDQVFHASPYLNDWEGTYNGEPLPAGTYFYVVEFSTQDAPKKGFLILQR
jgi:gliding motility-associated-like protein